MKKSFYQYFAESMKEYRFRLKTVLDLSDAEIEKIKKVLDKYDLVKFEEPKKTVMQYKPLDFQGVNYANVTIIDFVVTFPVAQFALQLELCNVLGTLDRFLVVRGDNEPNEIEQRNKEEEEAEEELKETALMDDPDYSECPEVPEVAYGDEYNKKLLDYLASVAAKKEPKVKIDTEPTKALFDYIENDKSVPEDFNKDYDTPKPVHRNEAKKEVEFPASVDVNGQYTAASLKDKG